MKIAQIAPIIEKTPPKKYGGTERMIHALTEELVRRGHDVTLFATGNSDTSAKLASVCPKPLREMDFRESYGANVYSMLHIGTAYEQQDEFDIIHDHNGLLSIPTANMATTPVIMTAHNDFNQENRIIYQTLKHPYQVTISKAQATMALGMNHLGTVYNGLPLQTYPFSSKHDGYLLYVARCCMEKGLHHAITVAEQLNLPLLIGAKLESFNEPYFQKFVKPHLSKKIIWLGEVDEEQRNQLMSKAMCFLHPVTWPEPFGLTLIEAMACGAPVVAFKQGSISEIIRNGETGFVIEPDNVKAMIEAVRHIDRIDRFTCRQHALANFNATRMANAYEMLYEKVLKKEATEKHIETLVTKHAYTRSSIRS